VNPLEHLHACQQCGGDIVCVLPGCDDGLDGDEWGGYSEGCPACDLRGVER